MLIYKVTNLINNKIYIGKTKKSLEIRKRSHIKRMQSPKGKPLFFQRALKKYGLDNFKWEVLLEGCMSDEELCEKERYYIKFYNSNNRKNGYNLTEGGDGVRRKGWKHYEKTKLNTRPGLLLAHCATFVFMLLIALLLETIVLTAKMVYPSFYALIFCFALLLYFGIILYDFWDYLRIEQ